MEDVPNIECEEAERHKYYPNKKKCDYCKDGGTRKREIETIDIAIDEDDDS